MVSNTILRCCMAEILCFSRYINSDILEREIILCDPGFHIALTLISLIKASLHV